MLKVIRFPENRGLGEALKVAIENCTFELIARMDSDDISVPRRFESQLKIFTRDDDIDICGGQIDEFIDSPSNVVGRRLVPETDEELKAYMKKRCPFNHMTVMYKKSAVIDAGNYQDWFWNEDYYLWIRMALKNQKFANLPDALVNVRVGKDMYARRGGGKYFKSEIGIQKLMLEKGLIDRPTYISNCAKRFIVQKILPNSVRGWVFKTFARSN
ncbi:MAG: glycosyltransferase [Eubacterium sp.]|nr:glycosyltransferase [Eubacterium sp.]